MRILKDFFVSLVQSLGLFMRSLFHREQKVLRENSFLDMANFFFHIGPKSFWKAPSGIKIGRSVGTFLHYVFKKEEVFIEKKRK